jgi:hypothetical protein
VRHKGVSAYVFLLVSLVHVLAAPSWAISVELGSALADTRFTSTLDVGENLGLCPSDAQPIAGVARAGDEANLSGG